MIEKIKELHRAYIDTDMPSRDFINRVMAIVDEQPDPPKKRFFVIWWRYRNTVGYKVLETNGRLFDWNNLITRIAKEGTREPSDIFITHWQELSEQDYNDFIK